MNVSKSKFESVYHNILDMYEGSHIGYVCEKFDNAIIVKNTVNDIAFSFEVVEVINQFILVYYEGHTRALTLTQLNSLIFTKIKHN